VHAPEFSKVALIKVKKDRLVKEKLGLSHEVDRVPFDSLDGNATFAALFEAARQKDEKERVTLDNQVFEVTSRFFTLQHVFFGDSFRIVPGPGAEPEAWHSFVEQESVRGPAEEAAMENWRAFLEAYAKGDGAAASSLVAPLAASLAAVNPAAYPKESRIAYEVTLNRTKPFFLGAWTYFLAFALFLGCFVFESARLRWIAIGVGCLGAAFHIAGMTLRVLASERQLVSNIPETLLWISFGAFALALIFELKYRVRFFGAVGTGLAGLGLLYFNFCPFPTTISPLMPVLASNYWLTVHVLTITLSYAALLLAGGLGVVYVWCRVFNASAPGLYPTLTKCLFPAIHIGILLLAAGVILGGVWANESWGRYWGWDPKETWAFITLLWFLAIVHGRMVGYTWFRGLAVAGSTVFGAGLTLFTWWGVNFIPWFVGLHSYAGASAEGFKLSSLPPAAHASAVIVLGTIAAAIVKGLASRGAASAGAAAGQAESVAGAPPSGRPGGRPV
jgi:ABC-type transport system involved in cytochrome c biogenesis permease subunit